LRADIGKQPAIDMAKPTHTTRRTVRSFTARLRFARPIRMDESWGSPISRRIIEDRGGHLRLAETSSNGCTFQITLSADAPLAVAGTRSFGPGF